MRTIRFVVLALGASVLASPVAAQTIAGRVVDRSTHLPARLLTVLVLGDSDRVVARTQTDTTGVFYASLPAGGEVHLRFALDSTSTFDSSPITVGADAFVQREFVVPILKVYFEFQVEKQVTTADGSPQPRYPAALKQANVQGEVLVQFVVDTLGRADMRTFKVLRSTDIGFTFAVRDVLPRMKFNPAELHGAKVRQMVQQPFTFALMPD
jgi:TonB family protein